MFECQKVAFKHVIQERLVAWIEDHKSFHKTKHGITNKSINHTIFEQPDEFYVLKSSGSRGSYSQSGDNHGTPDGIKSFCLVLLCVHSEF